MTGAVILLVFLFILLLAAIGSWAESGRKPGARRVNSGFYGDGGAGGAGHHHGGHDSGGGWGGGDGGGGGGGDGGGCS